jgi:DNA-binding PucR family transcriptional regulator
VTDPANSEALATIIDRLSGRLGEVGDRMLDRYEEEISDYAGLRARRLGSDVRGISLDNLRCLLRTLPLGVGPGEDDLERSREGAARRVLQGVSLESMLHAYRLWGQIAWASLLEATEPDNPAEREAALYAAGRVIAHIDRVSTAAAQAYLDEVKGIWSDRQDVRRDLLDALVAGTADPEDARRQAGSLRLRLGSAYMVLLARHAAREGQDDQRPLALRSALRRTVATAEETLRPSAASLLVGVRQQEVVALYPVAGPAELDTVKAQAASFALAVAPSDVSVGLGTWHPGLGGIPASFAEARESVEIGLRSGRTGRVTAFDEVLIDHIVRSSPHSDRMLADTLGPLREYDTRRRAALLPTLQAFFDSGFNVTRSAQALCVHPNTVVYRLRRIRELTGRDPQDPDDLLLLSLSLKLIARLEPQGEQAGAK